MCGISGFNWKDSEKAGAMAKILSCRGPDALGVWTDKGISFGHNRLSIIDLSEAANQPMFDNNKDLAIVFNGEIYNFKELKKELESEYEFKTKSDTEVILAGYRKWGKAVVEKLNGMFALAIWDKRSKSLFLARDHAGMKPLYYYWDGKKFIFASEIPAILTHEISRKLNIEAFNIYLRTLYVPSPLTLIQNIYKLPPSHLAVLKEGILTLERFGINEVKPTMLSYNQATRELRGEVIKSVERHLISDVPVGVYLSGGIDSSTVLFCTSKFREGINTFSVGFDLGGRKEEVKFNQDFNLARRTAQFFGTIHHEVRVSVNDALDAFDEMVEHNSDPISNPTAIAMLLLAKFARKEVTVALTGNAGDEFFGGYDRYRMALAAHYYRKLPEPLRAIANMSPRISKLDYKDEVDLFGRFMFEKSKDMPKVVSQEFFKEQSFVRDYFQKDFYIESSDHPVDMLMRADQRYWLPDHFFMLSDKMSMASGLEERMPLADKDLVNFARALPLNYRLDLTRTKKILKDAFRNDLPDFLFNQPKRGWFSPAAKWLREPRFENFAKEVLSPDYYSATEKLFNWGALQDTLLKHINKETYNLNILWAFITFQTWAKKFKIEL